MVGVKEVPNGKAKKSCLQVVEKGFDCGSGLQTGGACYRLIIILIQIIWAWLRAKC